MAGDGLNPFSIKLLFRIQAVDNRQGIAVVQALADDAEAALADLFLCGAFAEKFFNYGSKQFVPGLYGCFHHAVKSAGGIVHLPGDQLFMPDGFPFSSMLNKNERINVRSRSCAVVPSVIPSVGEYLFTERSRE